MKFNVFSTFALISLLAFCISGTKLFLLEMLSFLLEFLLDSADAP